MHAPAAEPTRPGPPAPPSVTFAFVSLPVPAPDRPLVRAATTPLSGLAAVGGGALGFIVLGGFPGAIVLAVLAVLIRVGLARFAAGGNAAGAGRAARIDPFAVKEPWRRPVQDALSARNRFTAALEDVRPGPLLERLEDLAQRVGDGVEEVWRAANQGQKLAEARRRVPTTTTEARLAETEARLAALGDDVLQADARDALERTGDALRAQLESARRLDRTIDDARARLRLQNARLDESVARAVELSVHAGGDEQLAGVAGEIELVVTDLEALRRGLEELGGPAPGTA